MASGSGRRLAEGNGFKAFGLILAAVATVMGGSVLFALDAMARYWELLRRQAARPLRRGGTRRGERRCVLGPSRGLHRSRVGRCGRPCRRTPADRRVRRAGWLLGIAVACQPLALLAVAPVVARFGWRGLRGRSPGGSSLPSASSSSPNWWRRPLGRSMPSSTSPTTRPAESSHAVQPPGALPRARDVQRRDPAPGGHRRRRRGGLGGLSAAPRLAPCCS